MMNKTKRPWLYAAVATVMLLGSCSAIAKFFVFDMDEDTNGGGGGNGNGTFVFDSPIVITTTAEWDAVFAAISNEPDGPSTNPTLYILYIQGSFDVKGTTTPNISGEYKKVQLIGPGTVSLSSKGSIIQTAVNQTYIFDGPTFVGMAGNNRSVVRLDSGSVELRNGAISDNTTTESNGGGVSINNGGMFTMSGGEISRNTTTGGYGGGVYVTSTGTFTMSGNNSKISGNTASANIGSGGGVYVTSTGTFMMSGGEISGNHANYYGGGVHIYYSSSSSGTFTMTGGTIYGKYADTALKNTAGAGAAGQIMDGSREDTISTYNYP